MAAALALAVAGGGHRGTRAATVVQNFAGLGYTDVLALGRGLTPPDTMGAAGLNEFVEFINGGFAIYSKTGTRQSLISDNQFWLNAGIGSAIVNAGLSDPRIIFDPTVNRWIATEINVSSTNNQVLVARSDSSDPAGTWKAVSYTGVSGQFADYDTLAVDADRIMIGTNNFSSSTGTFSSVTMTVIPKADILASTPTVANYKQFTQANAAMGWTPQGVTNFGASTGSSSIFAVNANLWNRSNLTRVTGSGTAAALGSTSSITTLYDVSPGPSSPVQPGGTAVDGLDDRYSASVVQVGGLIYATNTVLSGTVDAVRWLVVSASTRAVVGQGIIADPNYDFFQPSIGVNAAGTFLLGFNRVGRTAGDGNLSIYAAVGTTSGTTISVGSPFLLHAGSVSNFTGPSFDTGTDKRWGDYSATTVDPNNSDLFWTIAEVPVSSTNWGTRIIGVAVPEPSAWAIALAGLACGGWSVRRRRRLAQRPC